MTATLRTTPAAGIRLAAILMSMCWPTMVPAAEPPAVYRLQADGLACPFCAYGIEKQLGRIAGVASVSTDIKSGTLTISMQAAASLTETEARRAVEQAGFTLRSFNRKEVHE